MSSTLPSRASNGIGTFCSSTNRRPDFLQGENVSYAPTATEEEAVVIEPTPTVPAPAPPSRRSSARDWWQGAKARCALRFAPWLAVITALLIFFSESKTAVAAFDAAMKTLVRSTEANKTAEEQTFFDDFRTAIKQGLFDYYYTHIFDVDPQASNSTAKPPPPSPPAQSPDLG